MKINLKHVKLPHTKLNATILRTACNMENTDRHDSFSSNNHFIGRGFFFKFVTYKKRTTFPQKIFILQTITFLK